MRRSLSVAGMRLVNGCIKSVQRGAVTIAAGASSGTATIVAVNPANTVVNFLGFVSTSSADGGTNPAWIWSRLALTNGTTLTATRANVDASFGRVVRYEVVEYWPGTIKSVQRGTVSLSGVTTATATINGVNTTKAFIRWLGYTTAFGTISANVMSCDLALTDGTTVTATVPNAATTLVPSFEVVEFY